MLKRFLRCLSSSVLLWFFSMALVVTPAQAQLIGTHLGEGDISAQIEIMQMISSQGVPDGFPVTIQVRSDTPPADLQRLADTVNGAHFFAIVRIDGVCIGGVPASVVDNVRAAFGPTAVIAYGNEVNNQDKECADWNAFNANLGGVIGKSGVAPSALDAYMGLEQFTITTMFNSVPALKSKYSGANTKVGNAYGCVGVRADTCDIAATTTQDLGISPPGVGTVNFLTEFSLSPESRVADAPDTDLKKVVDFIETRGAEAASKHGIQKITPLIRNTCNSDGEWLIYLGGGKVVTKNGTPIDPETCAPGESDLAPYYLYPIDGINEKNGQAMKDDLYAQGYQAYCSSPQLNVRAVVNNLTAYLYDYVDEKNDFLKTEFSFGADYSKLGVPLWRDEVSNPTVMSSLENYWGYLDPNTTGTDQLKNSAMIYGRTTLEQQCSIKTNLLQTVKTMCEGLENPETCPLYGPIAGADFTFKDMIDKSEKAFANGFTCQNFGNGEWQAQLRSNSFRPKDITREELTQFTEGIRLVPFYLDKAYRLGFIVLSMELKKPIEPLGTQPFTFLRGTNTVGTFDTIHEVRIIPFRLPDIGTNRDPDSPIYYKDVLQLTRDTMLTPNQIADIDAGYELKRTQVADLHTHIDCSNNSDYCTNNRLVQGLVQFVNEKLERSDKSSYRGKYPAPECELEPEDIPYEEVEEIFGPGGLPKSDGAVVKGVVDRPATAVLPASQANTVDALREEQITQEIPIKVLGGGAAGAAIQPPSGPGAEGAAAAPTPPAGLEFKFLSEADAEVKEGTNSHPPDQADGVTKIKTYLIVPQGYQLESVENTLAAYFTPQQNAEFKEMRANEEIPLYFPLDDTGYNQPDSGFPITKSVTHTNPEYCTVNPVTSALECKTEILKNEVKIEFSGRNPNILGGTLGYLMREIQKAVLPFNSPGWIAVDICETTEDYLLGKCSRSPVDGRAPGSAGGAPIGELTGSCNEMYGSQISTVYDVNTIFRKLYTASVNNGIDPRLMWGIFRIEGYKYRDLAYTLQDGQQTTIKCSELINSCGAVGPLQIIQGACTTQQCPSSLRDEMMQLVRSGNLCNLDDSIAAAIAIHKQNSQLSYVGNDPYKLAGRYNGIGDVFVKQNRCGDAPPVSGCGTNYCVCAVEGFDNDYYRIKAELGL